MSSDALAALSADPGGRVSFTAIGPGGLKIVGNTSDVRTSDDGQTVRITVALAQLTTGIELRDKHMREKYLETATYPTTELAVSRAALTFPAPGATFAGAAQGTLRLHGQSHPASFQYSASNDGGKYRVNAKLHVDMRDYGITIPQYMGLSVKPDVDVDVQLVATDR